MINLFYTSYTDTHSQLKRNKILSKQLKSKVTRLVYLLIGTGALTGIFITLSQSIITSKWAISYSKRHYCQHDIYHPDIVVLCRLRTGHSPIEALC